MNKNIGKSISMPFLKTKNPLSKKWYVVFRYKNSQNEQKEYKKTYDLNKQPYVINGVINDKPKVIADRLKYANELLKILENQINTREFNIDKGTFEENKEDLPLFQYLDSWLQYKKQRVKETSLLLYSDKINQIKCYLISTNKEDITIREFTSDIISKFLETRLLHSNSLYNYYLVLLKNVFNYLIKVEKLNIKDETKYIEKLKTKQTEKHAKYSDVHQAIKDLTNYNYYLGFLAKTIYYTLHRIDTLTQLQYKDFDIDKGIINIPSDKIKTNKKLTIRISKHLLPTIQQYVQVHKPQPNDYFLGHKDEIEKTKSITMFASNKSNTAIYIQKFLSFKKKQSTNKELFTSNHTLYGFKHNGVIYYKDNKLSDEQIIKITGHTSVNTLRIYSKEYEAIIDEDIFNSLP